MGISDEGVDLGQFEYKSKRRIYQTVSTCILLSLTNQRHARSFSQSAKEGSVLYLVDV